MINMLFGSQRITPIEQSKVHLWEPAKTEYKTDIENQCKYQPDIDALTIKYGAL